MGFLDKLKIKKKDTSDVAPPPPPAPPKQMQSPSSPPGIPPLPQPVGKNAPKMDPPKSVPPMPAPSPVPVAPAPKTVPPPQPIPESNPLPPMKMPPSDEKPISFEVPKQPSREDMRSMSDMPPIKVSATEKDDPLLTEDHVKDLDVDKFVLPNQAVSQASREMESNPLKAKPAPKPQQPSHQKPATPPPAAAAPAKQSPLFIDVATYEDVQQGLNDLKTELTEVTKDLENITQLNKQEDEQFAHIVEKLETVQDRILRIDQDIFEKQ